MELGLVRSIDIDREMQQAYLDYAMSVIVARALPDARDGLKPVHRRILYAMYDLGMRPDTPYKKSARIVGEVLGKYHPHGDLTVYEAMARMAQDFSMRCLLVEGQGNFGSVDGDPPAAMRYTEARLATASMEMLADIRKNTVNFSDNFDGTLTEPDVLPAALPNLLINGATGIAVGMSTSIPPHNLGEVIDALVYMLGNWEQLDDISVDDLMHFIQGPDFPTGGVILQIAGEEDLHAAYGSGRGRVTVQAKAHLEEMSRGRNRIIVTELPYMTNKASLIERIAELAREERLEGIADLRDESDRQGLRIVIELSKTADPEKVLQDLYKSTPMRSTFSIIMLALVDGEPRTLTLKQSLRVYLDHRQAVIRRRSEYDLEKARQRAHILEGLMVALNNLDEVINLIRRAPDADTARLRLIKRFKLSEIQAQAILDMQLRRLAALERKKIEAEYQEVGALIKELVALLRSPVKMRQMVASELGKVRETFADRRRTQIARLRADAKLTTQALTAATLLPERSVWISVMGDGLVARTLDEKPPRLSGNAAPRWLLKANTRDTLYLATTAGEAAGAPVTALPECEDPQQGLPFHRLFPLSESDRLAALFTLPPKEERADDWYVCTITRQGMVKKTSLGELPGPTAKAFALAKVNEGDALGWVHLTDGKAELFLVTAQGMAIRFSEDEVRPMGLVAAGVGGIKLAKGDELSGGELMPSQGEVLFIASDGRAKRLEVGQFPVQGRYGQGVIAWRLAKGARLAGLAAGKGSLRITLHLAKLAPKAVRLDEAALSTRATQGKPLVELKIGDVVTGLTIPLEYPRPLASGVQLPGAGPEKPEEKPVQSPARTRRQASPASQAAPEGSTPKPPDRPEKSASAAQIGGVSRPVKARETASIALPAAKKSARQQTTPAAKAPVSQPASKKQANAAPAAAKPGAKKPVTKRSTPLNAGKTSKAVSQKPSSGASAKSKVAEAAQLSLPIEQTGVAKPGAGKKAPVQKKPSGAASKKPASTKTKPGTPPKTPSSRAKPKSTPRKPGPEASSTSKKPPRPASRSSSGQSSTNPGIGKDQGKKPGAK
jgi:DNA gyrase subunit A